MALAKSLAPAFVRTVRGHWQYSLQGQGQYRRASQIGAMSLEKAKQLAAFRAVDECVGDDTVIGVGSGSTIVYAVQRLKERVDTMKLNVICIPTSFQARQLIIKHKLVLGELEIHPVLDVAIDGADEVDTDLTLIKGGGGCLLQEKIVASCAKKLVIVADYTKDSKRLGEQYKKGIPVEVVPFAFVPIKQKIESQFGGELHLRMAIAKAGPCVTDNGNFILDWNFPTANTFNWEEVNRTIISIPGVVETGLFVKMTQKAYFGLADGTVRER